MRRPGLLLAGMLLATGGALAVAGPVSADVGSSGADSTRWHCHGGNPHRDNDWDDGDDWTARRHNGDNRRRFCHRHRHGHGSWHGHHHGNWHGGPVIVTRPR